MYVCHLIETCQCLSLLSKSSSPVPHVSSSDVVFCFIYFFSNANAEIPHSFSDVVQHNILLGSEKRRSLLCYKIRSQDKEMKNTKIIPICSSETEQTQ